MKLSGAVWGAVTPLSSYGRVTPLSSYRRVHCTIDESREHGEARQPIARTASEGARRCCRSRELGETRTWESTVTSRPAWARDSVDRECEGWHLRRSLVCRMRRRRQRIARSLTPPSKLLSFRPHCVELDIISSSESVPSSSTTSIRSSLSAAGPCR